MTRKASNSYVKRIRARESLTMIMNAQISILSILRQGTGAEDISPIRLIAEDEYPEGVVNYMGRRPDLGKGNQMVFSNDDLKRPVMTANNRMRDYLEPELNQRLKELETDKRFSAAVRKTLFEVIPSGAVLSSVRHVP